MAAGISCQAIADAVLEVMEAPLHGVAHTYQYCISIGLAMHCHAMLLADASTS